MKSSPPGRTAQTHAVRFYESTEALSRIVGEFLSEGIAQGSPALVIATPAHRSAIESNLRSRGHDVPQMNTDGHLTTADAEATLNAFMVDGMPSGELFRETMVPVLETITRDRKQHRVIRAYGEMVDVLWRAGQPVAAIKLEMLWNELAQSHDFSLLCGYSMGNFYKRAAIDEICQQHTHVVSSTGAMGLVD